MVVALLVATMSLVMPAPATAAPPVSGDGTPFTGISVSTEGATILAGQPGRVSVTATNSAAADLYNASVVVVLPLGVTYAPGSSLPGAPNNIGEPTITTWIPDPAFPLQTAQVLVWSNATDLPIGAESEFSFEVEADDALYPVGSTFPVDAGVYANTNERIVPSVTVPTDGSAPVVTRATAGGDDSATVQIGAIDIAKSSDAPETEVYRGAANPVRFTLNVETADAAGSNDVIVTDLVPATFQVVDCNLGPAGVDCTREIVEIGGEVFTQLKWNLGAVPAATTRVLTYSAFVGLQEITMPAGAPTGAPTRPDSDGYIVTNTASVSANYVGGVATGETEAQAASDDFDSLIVDLGIVKSSAPSVFFAGQDARFTLSVRTSEYVSNSTVTLVDTLADGLCPIVPAGVAVSGVAWPAECPAPGGANTVDGGTMTSAVANANGTFTVTFDVPSGALAPDQDALVSYDARMRFAYSTGESVASGETVSNAVEVNGGTTPAPGNTVDTGIVNSENSSSVALETSGLALTKSVWTNPTRAPIAGVDGAGQTCASATAGEYVNQGGPLLQLGDLACFRIRVDFSEGSSTRDVVVSDFLPPGTELIEWADGPGNTVAVTQPVPTSLQWAVGTPGPGSARYVAPGGVLVLDILLRVNDVPEAGESADLTGNLAKLRFTGAGGRVVSARDDVDLTLAPIAPMSMQKTVEGVDDLLVDEDDVVTFTMRVTHDGTAADKNDYPLNAVTVWDALPLGFLCETVSSATPASASCAIATTGPMMGRAVLTWNLSGAALGPDNVLSAGESAAVTYQLEVPEPLSIGTSHTNLAAIVKYTTPTTDGTPEGGDVAFYPENVVGAFPDEDKNAPESSDTATIRLGDAQVAKRVVSTDISQPGNTALTQATLGEGVNYEFSVTIPARTSVFNGVLADALPAGSRLVQAGDPSMVATPAGATVTGPTATCTTSTTDFVLCNDGTLRFPSTWTNTATTPVTFTVALPVRVANVPANIHGSALTNTASFTSAPSATGTPVLQGQAARTVTVVEPNPTLVKTATPTTVTAGQSVTYTLTATNGTPAGSRSPLFDAVVVDCVPNELDITMPLPAGLSGPVDGDGANGCPATARKLTWTLASPFLSGTGAGQRQAISYAVTVPSPVAAGQTFTNEAALSGSSMPGTVPDERTYTAAAEREITVQPATITKAVNSPFIVPGQSVTWTATASIPANVTLYNAAITDLLNTAFGNASNVTVWDVTCGGGDATWQATCVTASKISLTPPRTLGIALGTIQASTLPRSVTLTFETTLPAGTTLANATNIPNTANIRWNLVEKTDPPTAVGSWDESAVSNRPVTQVRHPDVTVAKSVTDTLPEPGDVFTYSVTASARTLPHDVTAHNVVIRDTVPEGIVILNGAGNPLADGATTASGGTWNAAARTLTWTIPSITPGTPVTRTYEARLDASTSLTGDALVNTVQPQSWQSLATGGKTYGPGPEATQSVQPQFPLVNTTKSRVSPDPTYIGDEVTYRIELHNAGGATAASLDAVDTLPADWSYVPGSTQITVHGATTTPNPDITGQELRWSDLGGSSVNLLPGELVVITYRAVAADDVEIGLGFEHTNTAKAADVTDRVGGTDYNNGAGSYIGTSGEATAHIASSDVWITKTAGVFLAGGTGTFTLTVGNNGPDPASGISVEDVLTLPAGVTLESAVGAGWTCTTGTADVSCARLVATETLASGAAHPPITVTVNIAEGVLVDTEVPNTASVTSDTEDRTPGNNEASATGKVTTSADVRMAKSAAPATVVAGEPLTWTLTATNFGPSTSFGSAETPLKTTDVLPEGVSAVSIVSATNDVECEIVAGELACDVPFSLPVGAFVQVVLTGTVDSTVEGGTSIDNTATIKTVTPDPTPANNTDTSITPVTVVESLTVDKTILLPLPGSATPGETITYRVVVTNGGPSVARGVWVVDDLPAGVTFDSIVAGADIWTATPVGDDVRFDLAGVLPVGESRTIDFLVEISAAVEEKSLVNTATVSSTWRADQDDSSVPIVSNASADLRIVKTVDQAQVIAGNPTGVTYTLAVDNLGPSDALGPIRVTDLLPTGVTLAGAAPAGCDVTDEGGREQIVCIKANGLDAGEPTWLIELPVVVDAAATASKVENSASVSSPTNDPVPLNNTSTIPLEVIQRAQLTVVKTANDDVVTAGENTTWTITVTNSGGLSDAQAVTLTDVIDSNLTLVSATSTTDGVLCSGTPVVCGIGTLAVGESVVIELTTTVKSGVLADTVIVNTATALSSTVDPVTNAPATSTDADEVITAARSALTIVKDAVSPTVDAGSVAEFSLVVANTGPSDAATSVVVTDTLPPGLSFLEASTVGGPQEWVCESDASGLVITCTLEEDGALVTLPAGATAPTLVIAATVAANLPAGTVTNRAQVVSPSAPEPAIDTADVEVVTHADLELVKSHDDEALATAGLPFVWQLTVINHGPSDSVATVDDPITVRDVLPEGVTLATTPAPGGPDTTCSIVGQERDQQVVECVRTTTLTANASVVIDLPVLLAPDLAGDLTNTATVTEGVTDQPDEPVWPDTDSDTVFVFEEADLMITKVVDTADVVAGEQIQWTVTVTNLGPSNSDATEDAPITVVDALPVGVTGATASGDGWACVVEPPYEGRERLLCSYPTDLALGETATITVTGTVGSSVTGEILNEVLVAPGLTTQPIRGGEPDDASAESQVNTRADLAITKSIAEEIVAGAQGVYRLTVVNNGPSDAVGVVIADDLPEGLAFAGIAGSVGGTFTCEGTDSVECALAEPLPADAEVTLELIVNASVAMRDDIENTAVVSAETADPDLENNESTIIGTIVQNADLAITKSIATDIVAGAQGQYRLEVENLGPSDAEGVVIYDRLPEGLSFAGLASVSEGFDLTCAVDVDDSALVLCTLAEPLRVGEIVTFEITVDAAVTVPSELVNTAIVSAETPDSDLANNESSVTGAVVQIADLAITKSIAQEIVAGAQGQYRMLVTNSGPSIATGVVVTDRLPAGLSFAGISSVTEGYSFECDTNADDAVVCELAESLAVGESVTLDITVDASVALADDIQNTAVVSADTLDPDLTNNESSVVGTIVQKADLAITKSISSEIVAGGQGIYLIEVENLGPSDAVGIEISDQLPEGLTFAEAGVVSVGHTLTCAADADDASLVLCSLAEPLGVGDSVAVELVVDAAVDLPTELVNTATVTAATPDPNLENNESSVTGTVARSADLAITKTIARDIVAGEQGQYRMQIVNLGPSDATGVAITDRLPAGLTFAEIAAVSDGYSFACEPNAEGDVVCALAETLPVGATVTLDITVNAAADLPDEVENTAIVSSATPDPDLSNNTSTVRGTVAASVDLSIVKQISGTPVIGSTVDYTLSVSNAGPALAQGVILSDIVPVGLSVINVTGEGWSCSIGGAGEGTPVTCTLGELAPGSAATVTVTATVLPAAYPEITNTATVTSATPEAEGALGNNTSTVTSTVPTQSDLQIKKTLIGKLEAGFTSSWSIVVTNAGTTRDPGPITVTDTLPAGLTFRSATLDGKVAECAVDGQSVTCTIDSLAAGASATVVIDAAVSADASGTVVNTAWVVSPSDPVPSESSAEGVVDRERLAATGSVLPNAIPYGVLTLLMGCALVFFAERSRRRALLEG